MTGSLRPLRPHQQRALDGLRLLPTRTDVSERLEYDPASGRFTWKPNPARSVQWNARFAGKPTGSIDRVTGYARIRFDDRLFYAHRLAWLIVTGEWPVDDIDHRNGDRADNRFANLRSASRGENGQNAAVKSNSTSGLKGVSADARSGKWAAEISVHGRKKYLGLHSTANDAYSAYLRAKADLHAFQPIPRWHMGDQS